MKRLLASILALALVACDPDTTQADGTSSETQTTVVAHFYRQDGSPAVGASVSVFAFGDTTRVPQVKLQTGYDGGVDLPRIPVGKYSLIALDGMGNGVLNHDIVSTPTGLLSVLSDTLRPMATILGRVRLQPQHEGMPIRIQVLGTGTAVSTDSSGQFRISVPASWLSQLLVTAPSALYTATVRDIQVAPGEYLDLGEIAMSYNGLPVVEGLSGGVDENGLAVKLEWRSIQSRRVRAYEVLRSLDSGPAWVVFRSKGLLDTTFIDSVYRPGKIDVGPHRLQYSVRGVDSSWNPGETWRQVSIPMTSPFARPSPLVSLDTLGLLPDGCTELDTLAEGLVCMSQKDTGFTSAVWGGSRWKGLRRADSLRVWFSADGQQWNESLMFQGVLRAIPWKGGIWLARGIESGDSVSTLAGGGIVRLPGLKAVVVEGWTPNGTRIRIDTLPSKEGTIGHRLRVQDGDLLLSDDDVKFSDTYSFHSERRIRQLGVDGSWREPVSPGLWPSEEFTEQLNPATPTSEPAWVSTRATWQDWEGLQILRAGGYLVGRRSVDALPWRIASPGTLGMVRYRGDGWVVPAILTWRGCGIVMEEGRRLLRICRVP